MLLMLVTVAGMPMSVYAAEEEASTEEGEKTGTSVFEQSGMYTETAPDAINEILQDDRFDGAVEQIQWLTKYFDQFSVQVISVCAFLIIAAAFLKNAMAGAYCANSKFWDKVADAHAKKDAMNISMIKGYFSGGQYMNTTVAGFKDGLLALIPNVKAFTDFDDADIQPKQYFMKSIPQMCLCVIIGIFIYNGYYRDTAAVVGEFGSEAFTRVMSAASPSEFLDKISSTTGMPTLITDGRRDPLGRILNKIADDGRKAVITEFRLQTNNQKILASAKVENWVLEILQPKIEPFTLDEVNNAWKISAKTNLVPALDPEDQELPSNEEITGETGTGIYFMPGPVASDSDLVGDTTAQYRPELSQMYVRTVITVTRTESSGGANSGIHVDGSNDTSGIATQKDWGEDVVYPMTASLSDGGKKYLVPASQGGYTLYMTGTRISSNGVNLTMDMGSVYASFDNPNNLQTGVLIPFQSNKVYVEDGEGIKHKIKLQINTN